MSRADGPTTFGRYQLLGLLGKGGTARVYRALRPGPMGFGKEVALKIIDRDSSVSEESAMSLVNEARLGCLLRHRSIVSIDEFDTVDGTFYIAMEYVDGWPLDQLLSTQERAGGLVPLPTVLEILIEVADGLEYAHTLTDRDGVGYGIVHRDLKPGNVMISRRGEVKIADFGTAKATTNVRQTQEGFTRGTPAYMSPEQVTGQPLDGRSDIFSFGALLHELVTLEMAFPGDGLGTVMHSVLEGDLRPARDRVAAVAPALEPVLKRCMARDPAGRYQSAGTLAADLRRIRARAGSQPTAAEWLGALKADLPVWATGEFGWEGIPGAPPKGGSTATEPPRRVADTPAPAPAEAEPGWEQVLFSDLDPAPPDDERGSGPPAPSLFDEPVVDDIFATSPDSPLLWDDAQWGTSGAAASSEGAAGSSSPSTVPPPPPAPAAGVARATPSAPSRAPSPPPGPPPPASQQKAVFGLQSSPDLSQPPPRRELELRGDGAERARPRPPPAGQRPAVSRRRPSLRARASLAWSVGWKLVALYAAVLLFGPAMGGSIGQGISDLRDWQVAVLSGQSFDVPRGQGGRDVLLTDADFEVIPGGSIRPGDPGGEGPRPARQLLEVPTFSMMRHEVTVDAYRTACPRSWWQLSCPDWEPERWQKGDHPALRLTWQQAADWCAAQGWRLPTEVEWEYAARGEAGRRYPWGDEFAERAMNYCDKGCSGKVFENTGEDDGHPRTGPVGSFPKGATPEGIRDLAGNAAEWTLDCWTDHHEARTSWHASKTPSCRLRVARGGSWKDTVDDQTGWERRSADPDLPSEQIGFRCVQGEEPGGVL